MDYGSLLSSATSTTVGLGELAIGLINQGKANKRARELAATRPKLQASPYIQDALKEAESAYSEGMSPEAKAAYEEDIDRDQSSAVGASLRMGGTPNNVASIVAGSSVGRQRLAIMKDQIKMANLQNLFRVQQVAEESRQQQFQFNEWAPWSDAAQANAAAKSSAQSMIYSGLNTAAGGAMRAGETASANKQHNAYTSPPATTSTASSSTPNSSYLDGLLNNDE